MRSGRSRSPYIAISPSQNGNAWRGDRQASHRHGRDPGNWAGDGARIGQARLLAITGRTIKEGDAGKRPEAAVLTELKSVSGSLDSVSAEIEALGQKCYPFVLDLLDREALPRVAQQAIDALGHVDILVNNAIYVGPAGEKLFLDTPADELEKRLFGNITAQLIFTQPILRHMVARKAGVAGPAGARRADGEADRRAATGARAPGQYGVVGNVTSGAGYFKPFAKMGEGGWALSYGVSKAGLNRIAEQLVVEHPDDGVFFCKPAARGRGH